MGDEVKSGGVDTSAAVLAGPLALALPLVVVVVGGGEQVANLTGKGLPI